MNFTTSSNKEIHAELGRRIRSERLRQNTNQTVLAEKAGICRRTLTAAEQGEGASVETLLSILRALNMLDRLDTLLPEAAAPQRRTRKERPALAAPKPTPVVQPNRHEWSWE